MKKKQSILIIALLVLFANAAESRADDDLSTSTGPDASSADVLAKLNDAIAQDPTDPTSFIRRGNFYGERKMWSEARTNYEMALALDPQMAVARLDVAELLLRQRQFDQARPGFAALTKDSDVGDLASYKVFLCDLFAAHEAAASQELAVFNQAGENPSYYLGNMAWDVVHKDIEGARGYLQSALHIYNRDKVDLYVGNLIEMGYLPLPAPKNS